MIAIIIVSKRDVSILSAVCSDSFGYHGAIFLQRFGAPEMRDYMRRRSYFEDPIHHVAGRVSGQELCGKCRKICILISSMHLYVYKNIHTVNTRFFMYPDLSLSLSVLTHFLCHLAPTTTLGCWDQWSAPVFGQFDDIPRAEAQPNDAWWFKPWPFWDGDFVTLLRG